METNGLANNRVHTEVVVVETRVEEFNNGIEQQLRIEENGGDDDDEVASEVSSVVDR